MRAGVYVRVSTGSQEPMNQEAQLLALCQARGWDVAGFYRDVVSGADPEKVAFNRLMHDARVGKFGVVIFWAWDRVTRGGIAEAFGIMENWERWGVAWESLREPFLSSASDPSVGRLLLAIVAWVAERETQMIPHRTRAALAKRRALGLHLGRPKGAKDRRPRKRSVKRASPLLQ